MNAHNQETAMTAYAVADLHSVRMGPAIIEYLERIDAPLAPFGGRYIIHGGRKAVLGRHWDGDVIFIVLPHSAPAAACSHSPVDPAYLITTLPHLRSEGSQLAGCDN